MFALESKGSSVCLIVSWSAGQKLARLNPNNQVVGSEPNSVLFSGASSAKACSLFNVNKAVSEFGKIETGESRFENNR